MMENEARSTWLVQASSHTPNRKAFSDNEVCEFKFYAIVQAGWALLFVQKEVKIWAVAWTSKG